jgi:hypothetical protein
MAEAHMPGLSKGFAFYGLSMEEFLFPDASLDKPSEPGAEHRAWFKCPFVPETNRRQVEESSETRLSIINFNARPSELSCVVTLNIQS